VVLADRTANPAYVAADLLSQAEHDEDAFVALVTNSRELPPAVERELERQARSLPRATSCGVPFPRGGFLTRSLREAVEVVNRLAPEHLSIVTRDP